jgi:hypothetical protein
MIVFFAGDIHGRLTQFYDKVIEHERELGIRADWVLQTGSLGVWPDPLRIDRVTRRHADDVDFHKYYYNSQAVPRPTLFVAGRHEDHRWLNFKRDRGEMEILPNLHWLLNGFKTNIGTSVVGLGRVYSPNTYRGGKSSLKRQAAHYTRGDVERACSQGPTNILLTHEAPKGLQFGNHVSEAEGIEKICFATRPKLLVHGHYNETLTQRTKTTKTTCIGLANMEIEAWSIEGDDFQRIG